MDLKNLYRISDFEWNIPKKGKMNVDAFFVGSRESALNMRPEAHRQLTHLASLPGILDKIVVLPNTYPGNNIPYGTVSVFDLDDGVICPDGVGKDINCGLRTVTTNLIIQDIEKKADVLTRALARFIPSGKDAKGKLSLNLAEAKELVEQGARWVIEHRELGEDDDVEHMEDNGEVFGASWDALPSEVLKHYKNQLGTIGSGHNFLKLQIVDEIFDIERARVFGLFKNQVVVTIHTGSRGIGEAINEYYRPILQKATRQYHLNLPDSSFIAVPVKSPEGKQYLAAIRAAANFAFANRQVISHMVNLMFNEVIKDVDTNIMYDISHNMIKEEFHQIGASKRKVLVHRKHAQRSFPGKRPEVSKPFRVTGQPLIVSGSLTDYSYIMAGGEESIFKTFGSSISSTGRIILPHEAEKKFKLENIEKELREAGIYVKSKNKGILVREAPAAFKDTETVIKSITKAGLSFRVARLKTLGIVKG